MSQACVEIVKHSKIKLDERGEKTIFYLINSAQRSIEKVRVDGCEITNGLRCDWLLRSQDDAFELYVELKGSDVNYAFSQLEHTINKLGKQVKKRYCFVVCSRSPLSSPRIQIEAKRFLKGFNAVLRVKGKQAEMQISELL